VKAVVRVLFIGLVMVFAGLTSAHAEKAYWTLEAGLFSPEENAFDTGFSLQGSVGLSMAAIDPSLAQRDPIWSKVYLEGGIGYMHAEFDESVVVPGFPTFTVDGDVDVIPVTGTVLIRNDFSNNLELYGGGGLGLYLVMLEAGGADDSSLELGLHLLGGVGYKVDNRLALTAEVQWSRVGEDAAEGTSLLFGVRRAF